MERFTRESVLLSKVKHEPLVAHGVDGGVPWLAMAWAELAWRTKGCRSGTS